MGSFILAVLLLNITGGKIQGIVTDEDSGNPIPYANVIVLDTQLGAAVDHEGYFFILNISPGIYTVEISHMGYQTKVIKDVFVETNQTARLHISLKQSPLEVSPVTVISKTPYVSKDMTGTTYIIREAELETVPVDYAIEFIAFQPSVAHLDTAFHVRGGRATEVLYMIDNVSIIDPHSGNPVISIPKGVVNEVIFLPGGYDVEYGRAMSGVVNLVAQIPAASMRAEVAGKTETIMPFYYDFGYQNYQSLLHLPVSKRLKGIVSFDVMHTEDWNPRLFALPHKQRDDYTLYTKWLFTGSGRLKAALSGAKSRSQFDRYDTKWKFNLNHYRSDLIESDLQVINVNFLPDSRTLLNATLSRLHADRIYGVRERGSYGIFEDFTFRDYETLKWPEFSVRNPFGANYYVMGRIPFHEYPITSGDFPEYRNMSSDVINISLQANKQVHRYHEVKAGLGYSSLGLSNFNHFVASKYIFSGDTGQFIDEYHHYPKEYYFYVQDNIDYKGLYAKIGCRYDRFAMDIEGSPAQSVFSPRCGVSFMVTEKFLFRSNIGLYAQPPLYDHVYSYYDLLPIPDYVDRYLPLIGNPHLGPEKTMSYEIGLQGIMNRNLGATVNIFYKDVSNLIGTRFIAAAPQDHVRYQNIEYANVRGIETILEFNYSLFTGKVSYTISWSRGTSSYAEEVYDIYDWYDNYDTITFYAEEYYLNFDQRHRIFLQGTMNLPFETGVHLFGYFGSGFPYTPWGEEGKTEDRNVLRFEFQKRLDCVIMKPFRVGKVVLNLNVEVINILGERYQIRTHGPLIDYENIHYIDFFRQYYRRVYDITDPNYCPAADKNHDGLVTAREQYDAFIGLVADSDDWINAYSAPRRARLGVSIAL
ncbi:MAG: TonB-dependent receptor [candidate division WOR-3 bacterium]|jgi:outer membrane receptor protein involved in Fe transport